MLALVLQFVRLKQLKLAAPPRVQHASGARISFAAHWVAPGFLPRLLELLRLGTQAARLGGLEGATRLGAVTGLAAPQGIFLQ